MSSQVQRNNLYGGLLKILRGGRDGARFEREMKVTAIVYRRSDCRPPRTHPEEDMVRELHLAWGGRMIVNGRLEWLDFVRVRRSVRNPR